MPTPNPTTLIREAELQISIDEMVAMHEMLEEQQCEVLPLLGVRVRGRRSSSARCYHYPYP